MVGLLAMPQVVADEVPAARMRAVYEAVKTPCKVGMALVPAVGEMLDKFVKNAKPEPAKKSDEKKEETK